MKTCPKCGAENRQTASECRLCATPLEGPESLLRARSDTPFAEQMPQPVIVSGREPTPQHAPASAFGGHLVCPSCQAVNEPEWVFCMQCGKKLPRREWKALVPPASPDKAAGAAGPKSDAGQQPGVAAAVPPAQPAIAPPPDDLPKPPLFTPSGPDSEAQLIASPAESTSGGVVCSNCGEVNTTTGFYCSGCGFLLSPATGPEAKEGASQKAVLQLITEGGQVGEIHPLRNTETIIGRVEGDLIFTHDGYMSSRHARVMERNGRYFLLDQGSRNGTFIRISGEVELKPGDMFLVGKQLFRFER